MYGKTKRKSFARYQEILDMPNLLEVQKKSYQWFLDTGLREVFKDVDAITDYAGNLELSFIDYSMDEKPKYDVEECKARDATYAAPIKVKVRLRNKETEEIKEQEIFMGDFPIMTNSGTLTRRTRRTTTPTVPPSSPTGAPGWSMRPTCPTCSMCASTRTASCPSPA